MNNGETTLPISPSVDGREIFQVSGILKNNEREKELKKALRKLTISEEGEISGWIFKRDVPKFSEFVSEIDNAKFQVLSSIPEGGTGMGRKVKLTDPISLQSAIDKTKSHLGLDHLRLVLGIGHSLESPMKGSILPLYDI